MKLCPHPHPVVELGDEPQFALQVTPSFLCGDVPQDVLMLHTWSNEHVSFVLPRVLILTEEEEEIKGFNEQTAKNHLNAFVY